MRINLFLLLSALRSKKVKLNEIFLIILRPANLCQKLCKIAIIIIAETHYISFSWHSFRRNTTISGFVTLICMNLFKWEMWWLHAIFIFSICGIPDFLIIEKLEGRYCRNKRFLDLKFAAFRYTLENRKSL
jgi:hypothetical protein